MKLKLIPLMGFLYALSPALSAQTLLPGPCGDTWAQNNNCSVASSSVTFTPGGAYPAGSAYDTVKIDLTQPFDMNFQVKMAVDGMAFVLQNQGLNAMGGDGAGMGFGNTQSGGLPATAPGITPSVGVEIDTWQNPGPDCNDPPEDHLGVRENGIMNAAYVAGPVGALPTNATILDGLVHTFEVKWVPSTFTMSIYFDGLLRLTYTKDIVTNIFGGTNMVYWGWTGAASSNEYVVMSCGNTPTPTNTPTNSPTRTPTSTPTVTPTLTPTKTPTDSTTPTPTATATLTATVSPTPSPTNTLTNSPTLTPTRTPTNTATITPTPTPTNSATNSPTPTSTRTATNSPTVTPTSTPTNSATITPTSSPTKTATNSPTVTPTRTATNSPTITPTSTPTNSATITPTSSPTKTATNSPTVTPTRTATNSPTVTVTNSPTNTATVTWTRTKTFTPTATNSPTSTSTPCGYPGNTCTFTPTPSFINIFYVSENLLRPSQGPVSIYVEYNHFPGNYGLTIYNSAGERVKDLDNRYMDQPLKKSYAWDGTNNVGNQCGSGVYLFYLTEPFNQGRARILLVR